MFDGVDGKRYRGQHEKHGGDGGRFRERGGCAAGAEGRLAALASECCRDVASFTALQEDDDDQKQAYDHVNDGN